MTTTDLLIDAVSHWAPARHQPAAGEAGQGACLQLPLPTATVGYQVRLAASAQDVAAAGRLRQEVLAGDLGDPTAEQEYDDRSDHLIVWFQAVAGQAQVVGTARLLPPHANDATPRGAGLFADRQFGLRPVERLLNSTVEVGRICVHPEHRAGTALALLVDGIARYQHLTGYRFLLGSAPLELGDGGRNAAAFWDLAIAGHLAPAERRCRPRRPVPIGGLDRIAPAVVSPLLARCLRLGASVLGPPALAENGRAAEVLLLLDLGAAGPHAVPRLLGRDD